MSDPKSFGTLIPDQWRDLPYQEFRPGVQVHYLWSAAEGPVCAILRYAPGASVPRHRHTGLETILVLEGTQSDESGDFPAGSLIFNPAGSIHRVWSTAGCAVLIQWERPVEILE